MDKSIRSLRKYGRDVPPERLYKGFKPRTFNYRRDYVPEIQSLKNEALKLEQRLSDLVNQAYQLTPEEIDLMWRTAPPRMPIFR
ncbi:hypothetical protein H6G06_15850 [Anabaena sphaerica FACHB-251]|uniref:Uncharacterized protein n=1 Tax=Anabaena sphaerica FACHB-251 TaxID=2692883 RepID=A0A926WJD7_9NOST|nr:hypothetical protein [Anabaena sphaerica]MBD2294914.1 hypothetical protein [Anabaena sphaerica FACHB-251]